MCVLHKSEIQPCIVRSSPAWSGRFLEMQCQLASIPWTG